MDTGDHHDGKDGGVQGGESESQAAEQDHHQQQQSHEQQNQQQQQQEAGEAKEVVDYDVAGENEWDE